MAVLTNKPVRISVRILESLGLAKYFREIYGGNSFHTKKPDPTGLRALIREASALRPDAAAIVAEETVMIGDSDVDILTARNCGARSIGCMFGLAPHSLAAARPDGVVESPGEWPEAIRATVGTAIAR